MLSSLSFPTCIMGVHIVWLDGVLKNLTGSGDELFFRSAGKRLGGAGQEGKWAGQKGGWLGPEPCSPSQPGDLRLECSPV